MTTPTPCTGRAEPYDHLIEGVTRGRKVALKEARDMCNRCPIRDACWSANFEEPWVKAVYWISRECARDGCDTVMELGLLQQNKRYCSKPCVRAAERRRTAA